MVSISAEKSQLPITENVVVLLFFGEVYVNATNFKPEFCMLQIIIQA